MAKYMLLIYGDPAQWDAMSPEQSKAHDASHVAFTAAAGPRVIGGEQLESTPAATALRMNPAGEILISDGPFVETKETVGGYYIVDASDLDEVIALPSQLPEVKAQHSGVEIRPLVEHG